MDDKGIIDDYDNIGKLNEIDRETIEENQKEEVGTAANVEPPTPAVQRASTTDDDIFSDVKEYPESPFTHYETNQINVKLSNGALQYEVTDFVLPGRDGFDVSITRRYDSGCANLVDMDPDYVKDKYKTGSKDNSHNPQTYGLGYGWSFVLPTIEKVPSLDVWTFPVYPPNSSVKPTVYAFKMNDYILHLEDGRSLKMNRYTNSFIGYNLKDITLATVSGQIQHPHAPDIVKNYNLVVTHKNGHKDYFMSYKLVAREDRFGNVISYDLDDNGGMRIVDTWGRTLTLERKTNGLIWTLPGGEAGKNYKIVYGISYQADTYGIMRPQKLISATDQAGNVTQYDYHNPNDYKGLMLYVSKKYAGNSSGDMQRPYMLLKKITYPNLAETHFEYKKNIEIGHENGGRILSYGLSQRKDSFNKKEYNQTSYTYYQDKAVQYIEKAIILKHQDIQETYQFSKEELLLAKEIRTQEKNNDVLISKSTYKYDSERKLIISEVNEIYDHNKPANLFRKENKWEYSENGDITREIIDYQDDSGCNQEIKVSYGDFRIPLETTRQNGNYIIREKNDLSELLGNRVIASKQIYETDVLTGKEVLKEKTVYQYEDTKNPYCVTKERKYFTSADGNLAQTNDYVEIVYTYNSDKFTHQPIARKCGDIKDSDGKSCDSIEELFDYDDWGRITKKTNPRKQVTTLVYDSMGRVIREVLQSESEDSIIKQTSYQDKDSYITQTDAIGQKTRIQYTPFGQIAQICLAEKDQPNAADIILKDFQYNTWHELVKVDSYDGNGTASSHIRKTENYSYDAFGRIVSQSISPAGYEESYAYDEVFFDEEDKRNYYREQKTIKGDSFAPDIETIVYKDQKGQVRKEFLAGVRTAAYEYDNAGNVIRKVDAGNRAMQWEYDYAGRALKMIQKDGGAERIISFQYDELGNKRFSCDEANNQTEYQYDKAGRLIKIIVPFDERDQVVKYYYDTAGNVICEKKSQGNGWQETRYIYDSRNRLMDTYQYLNSAEWIRTRYQYDALGRVTWMRTGDTLSADGRQVTKYAYDRFDNVVKMTDANGYTEFYEYDKVGQKQRRTDRRGNRTTYQYDTLDRLIKEQVEDIIDNKLRKNQREYAYSKNGRLIRERSQDTTAENESIFLETSYYYNEKGQLRQQNDPGDVEKYYTYDQIGNRQSFRLMTKENAVPEVSLHYVYDDLYRLKQVRKESAGGLLLAEYEYDSRGNRKTLRYPQSNMETNYQYNRANRVISMETKNQGTLISAWTYTYDTDGNLLTKTNKASTTPITLSYRYDSLGRLVEENHPQWKRVLYEYDAYSNRTRMLVEGRTKEELVSVTNYEYDLGNRMKKETKKTGKITETWQYRYDDNGNETFRIWEQRVSRPDYPGNAGLSGHRQWKNPTVYEWRHYNGFNQLIRINQDEKEIIYCYRGDGLRHSSKVQNLIEQKNKINVFFWDGSDIIAEEDDRGSIKCYLRGINLIAREADDMIYYYLHNEHGDIAQLWSNGVCRANYEYDAFGGEKKPEKSDENPFRYCGEYLDLNSDVYYLRVRDYRSVTGRFTSEDTLQYATKEFPNKQQAIEPLSLNLYTYCYDNPIMFADPTGHIPFFIIMGIAGGILGGIIAAGMEAAKEELSKKAILEGIVVGAALGMGVGLGIAYVATGSAFASTGVVMGGLGLGTAAGSGVATGTAGTQKTVDTNKIINDAMKLYGDAEATPASDLWKQTTEQLTKSRDSLVNLIQEHIDKLNDYTKNPYAYDNKGFLANAPSDEIRNQIINNRIDILNQQISKQMAELVKTLKVLAERTGL